MAAPSRDGAERQVHDSVGIWCHAAVEFEDHEADLLGDVAVTACHEIAHLMDERAEPDEAAAYKAWVLKIGTRVAEAATEAAGAAPPAESNP